jgi:hypothetical protein
MKKLENIKETFGCEQITDLIPANQMRVFVRLGLGTRVLKVTKRKKGLTASGQPNQCHANVALLKKRFGGRHIKGYWVDTCPVIGKTALIWHSIWITPEGVAIDPTMTKDELEGAPSRDFTMFIPVAEGGAKTVVMGRDMIVTRNPKETGVHLMRGFDAHFEQEVVTIGQLSHKKVYIQTQVKDVVTKYNASESTCTWFATPSTATNEVLVGENFKVAA